MKNNIFIFFVFFSLSFAVCGYSQMSVFMEDYDWSTPSSSLQGIDDYFQKKSRRDKDDRNDNDTYEYRLQQQREAERRRIAEEEKRKAEEAEQKRREEAEKKRIAEQKRKEAEFQASHQQLKSSLHSLPYQSIGLKGQNETKYGLRGLNDNPTNSITPKAPTNVVISKNASTISTKIPTSRKNTPHKVYYKDDRTFLQEVINTDPMPSYYQGNRFWSVGGGWDFFDMSDEWNEEGEKNVKNHLMGKYLKWTKVQISNSSKFGAELIQLYESLSRAISIRNTETTIAVRMIDGIKKAERTGDKRYVENNGSNLKDVYKLTGEAGVYQVPLNKKEAVGWFQKYMLKKTAP